MIHPKSILKKRKYYIFVTQATLRCPVGICVFLIITPLPYDLNAASCNIRLTKYS